MQLQRLFGLVGLVLTLSVAASCTAPAVGRSAASARVIPNDNQKPAGVRRGDTLFLRLVLRQAEWFPQADSGPSLLVTALAEEGKAATIPAPLIRVPEGTIVDVTVRNALPSGTAAAEALGLDSYPQKDAKPIKLAPGDSCIDDFSPVRLERTCTPSKRPTR